MTSYLKNTVENTVATPQGVLARDDQEINRAGGYVWAVGPFERLLRFLILGNEGGTYYASQKKLITGSVDALDTALAKNDAQAIELIVDVSHNGRARRNDEAIFALAHAASSDNAATRKLALDALPEVCRIPTHLFMFLGFLKGNRGWGPALRRTVGEWYNRDSVDEIAYALMKYREREGWTHRDALRLAHVNPLTPAHSRLFRYVVGKDVSLGEMPRIVQAYELLRDSTDPKKVASLIREYDAPRELVPSEALTEPLVWEALLEKMPLTALIRNLANMTRIGLLTSYSDATQTVLDKIGGADLRKARIHPMQILIAQRTYASGHGLRGGNSWDPVPQIVDALDEAFYRAFDAVEPTNQNYLLAVDVSGSMDWKGIAGVPSLTPREAAAAMALVTAKVEPRYRVMGFATQFVEIPITPRQRIDDVCSATARLQMGGTDCSLPMRWAIENDAEVDVFVVYTDNETWAGDEHAFEALKRYRKHSGRNAKLAVVAFEADDFSIADPSDRGMIDFVGFDANAPAAMAEFARGNL